MDIDLALREVSKQFGQFEAVDKVSFDVPKGHFYSILGPSGCGKTTLLRMIAGFTEPSAGTIRIGGADMRAIPPNKRPVSLVFQHLALFPMMSVGRNIAFGLERRGERRATIEAKVRDILETVGLPGDEDKQVQQLSGGQMQRVAIARCLVLEPTVLLLDEPLGALDLKLREQMKVELKKLQSEVGTTFLYITHDQSEALVMSDRIAVMNKGRLEQLDTPLNCYRNPSSAFVAGFLGESNRWRGRVLEADDRSAKVATSDGLVLQCRTEKRLQADERVVVFVRAESIGLELGADGAARGENQVRGIVASSLFDGDTARIAARVLPGGPDLVVSQPQTGQTKAVNAGEEMDFCWAAESCLCFSEENSP